MFVAFWEIERCPNLVVPLQSPTSAVRSATIRTFGIVPLKTQLGIAMWVPGTSSLKSLMESELGCPINQHPSYKLFQQSLGIRRGDIQDAYKRLLSAESGPVIDAFERSVSTLPGIEEGGPMTSLIRRSSSSVEVYINLKWVSNSCTCSTPQSYTPHALSSKRFFVYQIVLEMFSSIDFGNLCVGRIYWGLLECSTLFHISLVSVIAIQIISWSILKNSRYAIRRLYDSSEIIISVYFMIRSSALILGIRLGWVLHYCQSLNYSLTG